MKDFDHIEKFIQDHRQEFDDQIPDNKIWASLESGLAGAEQGKSKRRKTNIRYLSTRAKRWLSAAAVLLLCISLAAFIRAYQVKQQMMDPAIPADLQKAQVYYENQIAIEIDRVKSAESVQNNQADTSLWQIFGRRDEEYNRIRKALLENPGNAHVRAAFVEYYRSRLSVLNQINRHLEATDSLIK